MTTENIEKLQSAINNASHICVFTGAGISCPSGIPDFRSADGLYNQNGKNGYSPEEIISHSFFVKNTAMFYEFYKAKMMYPQAKPNKAHQFFADLEMNGKKVSIVTQNIDGLHCDAGNKYVYELHGSVHRNFCMNCGEFYDAGYIYDSAGIPRCEKCKGIIKPDVVLYEEGLDDDVVNGAVRAISESDVIIVIGTSLAVYPAASFLRLFKGDTIALINKSQTPFDENADIVIYDDVVKVVEHLVV